MTDYRIKSGSTNVTSLLDSDAFILQRGTAGGSPDYDVNIEVSDVPSALGVAATDKWGEPKGGTITDGSDDYYSMSNPITDYPFSMVGYGVHSANSGILTILSLLNTGSSSKYFSLNINGNTFTVYRRNTTLYETSSGVNIDDGTYFVAAVLTSETEITLYVNGKSVFSGTVDSVPINSTFDKVLVGLLRTITPTNYLKGRISGVEVWNKALTATEVQQLWNNGKPEEAQIPYELQGASNDELIADSSFDDASKWTITSNVTVNETTGELEFAATDTTSYIFARQSQAGKFKIGKKYKVTIEVASYTSGNLQLLMESVDSALVTLDGSGVINGVGTYTYYITPNSLGINIGLARQYGTQAVMNISSFSVIQVGNVLDLKPENAGSNAWLDASGNKLHAKSYGDPIAMTKGTLDVYRDAILNITGNTSPSDFVPKGYKIESIFFRETNGGAATVNIGSTSGGNDVVNGLSVIATCGGLATIVKDFFSTTSDQKLYVSSPDWGTASVDLIFRMKKVEA